jgi:MSHA biogenesis protein MshI
LAQPVEESAIQAMRLPRDAYRGRMSMAHVIACPNEKINAWVKWAEKLDLAVEIITVPELSLLNVLAASSMDQGIALLELGPSHGCIRLYQDGALYLTRQVKMGLDVLDINNNDDSVSENSHYSDVNLEEMKFDDVSREHSFDEGDVDLTELQLEEIDEELVIDQDVYVGFSPKAQVNEVRVGNLVLEVQRSLDYYESQLGMGQITQLWIMGGMDLTPLVDTMQLALAAHIEQPDIAGKLVQKLGIKFSGDVNNINKSVTALGGALAYVAR